MPYENYMEVRFECSLITSYWNTVTPGIWPVKPEIFTLWLFTGIVGWLLHYRSVSILGKEVTYLFRVGQQEDIMTLGWVWEKLLSQTSESLFSSPTSLVAHPPSCLFCELRRLAPIPIPVNCIGTLAFQMAPPSLCRCLFPWPWAISLHALSALWWLLKRDLHKPSSRPTSQVNWTPGTLDTCSAPGALYSILPNAQIQ